MPLVKSRIPFNVQNPFRSKRPSTSKIVFLSCEGCVTEEEYFDRISKLFSAVKTKVQFISVVEDAVHTDFRSRTRDQAQLLSKTRPKQLVERIDQFKREKESLYQFSEHPDDEFWIVMDVDQNWSSGMVDPKMGKTYLDEWEDAVKACQEKGYGYAVSNPFFEIWLLLHHDDPTEEDKSFAVTDEHPYKKTNHFQMRLRGCSHNEECVIM